MDSRKISEKQARIATCEQAIILCERIIAKATANLAPPNTPNLSLIHI